MGNSLKSAITPASIANSGRMNRRTSEGTSGSLSPIIVVEGPSDRQFFKHLLKDSNCTIVVAHGKQKVVDAIRILTNSDTHGVLGIVDNDFNKLEGRDISNNFIIVTEEHDLEVHLVNSKSLLNFVKFIVHIDKKSIVDKETEFIRKQVFNLGKPLGYLRWHFHRKGEYIDFQRVDAKNFIDFSIFSINIDKMIDDVKSNNQDKKELFAGLNIELSKLMETEVSPLDVCQGHDLISILYLLLKALLRKLGPSDSKEFSMFKDEYFEKIRNEDALCNHLISFYELVFFKGTSMYQQFKKWEKNNPGYSLIN